MSTYSDNLKIEEIGTGEQAGTWGVTTNDNFVNVFEQAIVGRVTVSFSNADVTLTATNSVASQSFRNVYLNCTGTNAASRNLIVPTINKNYVVQNNTTGGFDIVVKTTAGTGITVPNGRTCTVYADGTNVIQAFDYLPTFNVPTLNITTLSVSGVATFSAGSVSLPSITTAGDTNTGIYFPAADTIGFTEGGVEALRLNSNGQTSTSIAGTASLPSFTRTGDENTGIFFPAADTIAFTEGGVESMRISSAGDVGIGSSTPSGKLQVNSAAGAGLVIGESNTSLNRFDANTQIFRTGSFVETMRIDGSGNVGINTTTPNFPNVDRVLSVNGSATSGLGLKVSDVGAASLISGSGFTTLGDSRASTVMAFSLGGSERMRIDSSGNVGVGITPSAWGVFKAVQVGTGSLASTTNTHNTSLGANTFFDGTNWKYIVSAQATEYRQNGGTHFWSTAVSGTAGNNISWSERMIINNAGDVGIGTSTPTSKLHVASTTSATVINLTNSTTTYETQVNGSDAYLTNYNPAGLMIFRTNGIERMRVGSNGNVAIGTTSTSGARLQVFATDAAISGLFDNGSITIREAGASSANNTVDVHIRPSAGKSGYLTFTENAVADRWGVGINNGVDSLIFRSGGFNGTERMRLTGSGNLGLNTNSPTLRLDVVGSSAWGTGTRSGIVFNTSAGTYIYQNNTNGSYEIGATVGGSAGPGGSSCNIRLGFYSDGMAQIIDSAASMRFGTSGAERMRINADGYMLWNTTNPTFPTIGSGNVISIRGSMCLGVDNFGDAIGFGIVSRLGAGAAGGTGWPLYCLDASGTFIGGIRNNPGTTTFVTSSDYRLKTDIVPMTGALERNKLLKPKVYKWKKSGVKGEGFLAHELQEQFPDAATGKKDEVDAKGNPVYQGIGTGPLDGHFSACINELQEIIEKQQTLIENLTTRLNALEGK